MKPIKAKKDFSLDGNFYIAGDEIKINDIAKIKMLNEKGFIDPLNFKDLVVIERQLKNKNYEKEEA